MKKFIAVEIISLLVLLAFQTHIILFAMAGGKTMMEVHQVVNMNGAPYTIRADSTKAKQKHNVQDVAPVNHSKIAIKVNSTSPGIGVKLPSHNVTDILQRLGFVPTVYSQVTVSGKTAWRPMYFIDLDYGLYHVCRADDARLRVISPYYEIDGYEIKTVYCQRAEDLLIMLPRLQGNWVYSYGFQKKQKAVHRWDVQKGERLEAVADKVVP